MRSTVCAASLLLILLLSPAALPAGVYGGTIKSVSPGTQRIVVEFRSGKTKTFQLRSGSSVKVGSKAAELDQLKPGMRVTVVTTSGDTIDRITARAASPSRPKPRPRSTPKEDSPRPKSGTGATVSRRNDNAAAPGEWPQFRGADRSNRSPETGLLTSWPDNGPPIAWQTKGIGEAYSSVSVAGGLLYTMGNVGGEERVFALDADSGREAWSIRSGPAYTDGTGNGPRGTPTIADGRVFALGGNGQLTCADARSGRVHWQKNILQEFGGSNITWGISESVLVDGDRVICTPGGRGATVVALKVSDGSPVWRTAVPGNPKAGYASPIAIEPGGLRQYVIFTSQSVIGVRASDGEGLWGDDSSSNGTANCATPLYVDGHVFSASEYGTGGSLLQLSTRGNSTSMRRVYHTDDMKNHHGGMVEVDGYLYGSNGAVLTCLELRSGRTAWRDRSVGKGSVVYADGHIYLRSENGPVALFEATSAGYREKGQFSPTGRSGKPAWSHPVIAGGRLYLRDMDNLVAFDLRASR
ncbi:MAG: PQQ-binding-like beta-propeller repeat protein [Planctomycetaceae bacterium]|nr:PQQ-binding-like beta-propeller repeat protein [Planctomycetaceae bacterium]